MDNLYTKQADSMSYDNLFGNMPGVDVQVKSVTILSGQGILQRGTVLGKITKAIGAPTADGGNTGNGTVTGVSLGKGAKLGTYTLECITATVNGGTFKATDPDNVRLNDAVVAVAFAGAINFTINDGVTDFAVGDKFTIVVSEGSKKSKIVNSVNVDGSQEADCILTDAVDATSADIVATAYAAGTFNKAALIFGGTDTAANHEARLRELGIFMTENISY